MGKMSHAPVSEIEATYHFLAALSLVPGLLGTFFAVRDMWNLQMCELLPDAQSAAEHLYI